MSTISVLFAGNNRSRIFELVGLFGNQNRFQIQSRVIPEGDNDPIGGAQVHPDILILLLDDQWQSTLEGLMRKPRSERPELIVIANAHYSDTMQLAMQAGARDYLVWETAREELVASLNGVASDLQSVRQPRYGRLISVINSNGGAGGSFVSANLGHMLSIAESKRVALVDLDLTFAPLPAYYDIQPRNSLSDALALPTEEIDETALSGFMTNHKSGVDVLANVTGHLPVTWATPTDRLSHLVELALLSYDYVIVDTPRHIEPQIQYVLERADVVVLMTQQSLMHVRDAKLLRQILTHEFDVADNKIRVVVNRFDKRNAITSKHIEQALNVEVVWQIPNDYRLASQSIESGALLHELDASARLSKAIRAVAADLAGSTKHRRGSLFSRFFHRPQVAVSQ